MPSNAGPSGYQAFFAVNYTGTGSEGTDFTVSLGTTMSDTNYAIAYASAGGTNGDGTQTSGMEVVDMPVAARTTTTFRVVLGAPMAAGDKLQFLILGNRA